MFIPGANVLTVEHRYFGKSIPSPCDWKHLTIKNAADDMHAIVSSFKNLYTGKWIATGASKGGQTALFFKRVLLFEPGVVVTSVPFHLSAPEVGPDPSATAGTPPTT